MSEALPGVPEAPPPATPRDASAVVLYRRAAGGAEVFWLKRERRLKFAGGFYAFPGGRLDERDAEVRVEGATGHAAALIVAAAREVLEETGVLVANGVERVSPLELAELRKALLLEQAPFSQLLAARGLTLRAADFPSSGRWVTPPFLPVRYDARFFLVEAPAAQRAEVWPGELTHGEWIRPADVLTRWEQGTALLHPPNLHAMRVMARFTTREEALTQLRAQPFCEDFIARDLEFQRGVHLVPLRTPTLPPATHTNTYLLGTGRLLLIDCGAPDDAEVERLVQRLDELRAQGCELEAIVLTHHHWDHVGGVARLVARTGARVWAHALTQERVPFAVHRLLADGEVLELDGPWPMRWRVLHTPGHARGHLCFVDEGSRAAVVGDLVAGLGTIVIDPPEGDMVDYLAQLRRLQSLPVGTVYPAHGPPIVSGVEKLEEYLVHRAWREQKVLDALVTFPAGATLDELVLRAYDDVPALVLPVAARNTVAILEKLVREGRAVERAGAWHAP